MKSGLKTAWSVYKPFRRYLYVTIGGLAAAQVIEGLYPFAYGKALNAVAYKQGVGALAIACAGLLVLTLFGGWVAQFRENNELRHLDFDLRRAMRVKTSAKLLALSVGQHQSEHSGVKMRIVNEGVNAISRMFELLAYEMTPYVAMIAFGMVACTIKDWKLGLLMAATMALVVVRSHRLGVTYGEKIRKHEKEDDRASKLAQEIVSNIELIKLNSKEEFAVAEQDRLLSETCEGWKQIWIPLNNRLWNTALLPRTMRIVVMFFAALRAYQGDITYGSALVIWRLSEMCLGRVGSINLYERQWISLVPKITRYVKFLELQPDVVTMPHAIRADRFMGEIEFRNVTFRYSTTPLLPEEGEQAPSAPERDFAVRDVSFTLEPGRSYALVGPSGSGKSTVKHLLVRSYDPTKGYIQVDRHQLSHLDHKLYLNRVGVVDQDIPLLDRTLRENLLFLMLKERAERISDEEIWQACKAACVDRFAHRLESGLDTIIGERGVKLSGGERQRVAIARAILKDPDIYIFDEATSSLDALNEDDIVRSIKAVSKGKTTLMIAHRFSTILSADELIVMNEGRVVGQGTHRDLYRSCPSYRELVGPQIRIVQEMAHRIA